MPKWASSRPLWRVSSAATQSACWRTCRARGTISPRLPIGVATTKRFPVLFTRTSSSALLSRGLLTALRVILVACGSQPPASRQEAYTTGQNPIQSAQAILARADTAAPPRRDRLLVEAAGFFAEGGR